MTGARTGALVERFAQDVTARLLTGHGVVSPLGLWLLLALLAPASTGQPRGELEAALGTDATDAARRAAELLGTAHPAVTAAVAVWADEASVDPEVFTRWAASLPDPVEHGGVPSQTDADRWARERTRGLVPRFPTTLDPLSVVVLASALVTDVRWHVPFEDARADELGGMFGEQVVTALRAPRHGHDQLLARTASAGVVGVHAARSVDGLLVVSVVAAPEVPARDVHRAAGEVADLLAGRPSTARAVSLFDEPLGAGHAWVVTEAVERRSATSGRLESVSAVLPAWSARSSHDLTTAPGVPAAFATLDSLLPPRLRPGSFDATQVAVAAYGKAGFTGAAVTQVSARAATVPATVEVVHRRAEVRFARPFAVLAVAVPDAPDPVAPWRTVDLAVPGWHGVPVFSAWVTRPGG